MLAAILTIGNEIVSGDTENTNASWLSRRFEELGVKVVLSAAVPDELDRIVDFVRRERAGVDHLIVTGGLGGTPDDITREALAAAFSVPQEVIPEVAEDLGPASGAIRTTSPGGLHCRKAPSRSRIRSAARPVSTSRTPGCCPASRAR